MFVRLDPQTGLIRMAATDWYNDKQVRRLNSAHYTCRLSVPETIIYVAFQRSLFHFYCLRISLSESLHCKVLRLFTMGRHDKSLIVFISCIQSDKARNENTPWNVTSPYKWGFLQSVRVCGFLGFRSGAVEVPSHWDMASDVPRQRVGLIYQVRLPNE
jgi:hypothetical protein